MIGCLAQGICCCALRRVIACSWPVTLNISGIDSAANPAESPLIFAESGLDILGATANAAQGFCAPLPTQ